MLHLVCYTSISLVVWLVSTVMRFVVLCFVFFQAEDGIRDLVRSRGLGDVYKRQVYLPAYVVLAAWFLLQLLYANLPSAAGGGIAFSCLLYTSDAADERSRVDLGGRRIIQKKKSNTTLARGEV